jgi:hypothetical protein
MQGFQLRLAPCQSTKTLLAEPHERYMVLLMEFMMLRFWWAMPQRIVTILYTYYVAWLWVHVWCCVVAAQQVGGFDWLDVPAATCQPAVQQPCGAACGGIADVAAPSYWYIFLVVAVQQGIGRTPAGII